MKPNKKFEYWWDGQWWAVGNEKKKGLFLLAFEAGQKKPPIRKKVGNGK